MTTLTLTPTQALRIAQRLQAFRDAESALANDLGLLTLGTPFERATLADINVDTGVLTFHVQPDGETGG